jgi:hypothetical protein
LEGVLGEIAERLSPHPPNPLLPEEKGAPESGSTPLSLRKGPGVRAQPCREASVTSKSLTPPVARATSW